MMKATGLKHLLRSIRKSGVSFLAVAVIAGVSIAIFQGFQSSAHAILRRADQYFVENRLETLEISCANGITQEDIDAIAAVSYTHLTCKVGENAYGSRNHENFDG